MAKRIDDSHQPFKRTKKIGPGPKKRPAIFEAKEFVCVKGPPSKTHYVQICKYEGASGKTLTVKVKTKKKTKRKYNKLYRKWAAAKRKALQSKGAEPGYKCRRTPSAKCR